MDANRTTAEIAKTCAICGQPIPKARLEAVPGVTTCVQCASKNPGRIDARKYDLSEASPINRNGFAPKD
jgi:RNA polymerase-binding transcription factor DksA